VLVEKYGASGGLRALDAMQLAALNSLGPQSIRHVYCADHLFVALIRQEGFLVINRQLQPPRRQGKTRLTNRGWQIARATLDLNPWFSILATWRPVS
jgi:hypothetical protein